jgi:DNA-binding SARP family transcriptional activator
MIRMIAAVRATITALVLLAGAPVLLVALGGSPVPARTPSVAQVQAWLDDPLQPRYVPGTARAVAWSIWALIAATILTVGVMRARRWRWARLAVYLPGPVQGLAATVLGAATVTTAVGIPAHAAVPATTSGTAAPSHPDTVDAGIPAPAGHRADHLATGSPVITVRRGDTLWDIAADRLGDPYRWKQIYRLNTSRHRNMRGGDHIEPGWTLALPTRAAAPGHRPPHRGPAITTPAPSGPAPSASPIAGRSAVPASTAADKPDATPTATSTARTSGPANTSTAGDPGRTAMNQQRHTVRRHQPGGGVSLAGGSWIDIGLAMAVAAAAALVWTDRRRRYTRRPPSPNLRLDEPDVAPMPPVVNQIRRRLRRAAADAGTDQHGGADVAEPGFAGPARIQDDRLDPPKPSGPDELREVDDDRDDDGQDDDGHADAAPRPVVPSLAHPLAAVWPPAGLGLTGPGAEAAARGFLAAGLAAGGLDEPDERSWVVMPSATAATLLGADAVALPRTPRLTVTGGLDEALDLLEAQTLHRSRIVYAHEVDTVADLRAADPTEEPLPPMLLLADASTRHQRTRIGALLAQGQRLDIHGVLLGAWPDGDTVVVAADGTTSPADGEGARHGNHPADLGRLAILTPAETSDLLLTLAESHTGRLQAPAPVEQLPTAASDAGPAREDADAPPVRATLDPATGTPDPIDSAAAPAANASNPRDEPAGSSPAGTPPSSAGHGDGGTAPDAEVAPSARVVAPGTADVVAADAAVDARAATHPDAGTEADDEDPAVAGCGSQEEPDAEAAAEDAETGPGRVEVTVLGVAGVVDVPPGPTLRKKSVEVLVYLAVHDGDASAEAILEDVMPDAPANKAPRRLYTYVSNLRGVMRHTGGRGAYVNHPGQRYVLNPDAIDIDLWRMRAAIRDADRATDPRERLAALRVAVDTYGGHLAEGADYEWIEPYREAVRVQALDAYLALAEALADTPAEQVSVLETAIRHNPYAEELYQQAMRARGALGHLDAVRTLRRALTRALGEIDAEPSDETIALADELIAQAQRPGRRPDLRPAPRPGDGAAA